MKTRQPCSRLGPAAVVALVALAACTDRTPVSPTTSERPTPSYAVQTARRGAEARHVVMRRGRDPSGQLRAEVEARGGAVEWDDPDIGVAAVDGLSDAAVAALAGRPDVVGIDQDVVLQWLSPGDQSVSGVIAAPSGAASQSGAFFFDFFQWNMRQIRAHDAWLVTDRGDGALVCILDTGIDPEHVDLVGKVDLAKSTSFVATEPFLDDLNTHGTFVAALVASNGVGMASVAPEARLCAVKVLNAKGAGSFADIIAGIMHAARAGADVINLSFGAYFSVNQPGARQLVRALQRAVDFATSKGALVVAAAGNDGINLDKDPPDFIHVPSQLDDVLSVGATAPFNQTNFDALASYTNFGRTGVDVMAPGGDLLTGGQMRDGVLSACSHFQTELPFTCSTQDYVVGVGTSFAAPHVAGAAAIIELELRGDQKGERLSQCLTSGADDLGRRGRDAKYGNGRVNVLRAANCRGHHHADED